MLLVVPTDEAVENLEDDEVSADEAGGFKLVKLKGSLPEAEKLAPKLVDPKGSLLGAVVLKEAVKLLPKGSLSLICLEFS